MPILFLQVTSHEHVAPHMVEFPNLNSLWFDCNKAMPKAGSELQVGPERETCQDTQSVVFMGFRCPLYRFSVPKKRWKRAPPKKQPVDQWKLRHHTVVYLQCSLASLKPPWFPSHCCDHKDVPRHQRWSSCEARTWVSLWQAAGPEFYRLGRL